MTNDSAWYAGTGSKWDAVLLQPHLEASLENRIEESSREKDFGVSHCLGLEEQRLTFYSDSWEVANDLVRRTGTWKRQD